MSVLSVAIFSISSLLASGRSHLTIFHVIIAVVIALTLSVSGDTLDFFIGRFATKIVSHFKWFKKTFSEEQLEKSHRYITEYGSGAIFISRYIPGIRTLTSYVAGSMAFPIIKFIFFNALANGIMLSVCAVIGYFLGGVPFVQKHFVVIITLLLLAFCVPTLFISIKQRKNKSTSSL